GGGRERFRFAVEDRRWNALETCAFASEAVAEVNRGSHETPCEFVPRDLGDGRDSIGCILPTSGLGGTNDDVGRGRINDGRRLLTPLIVDIVQILRREGRAGRSRARRVHS